MGKHIEFIARAVIVSGSRILLCRNIKGTYYYLPGGHVEHGESAARAVERELMEEGGVVCTATDCLLVHENLFEVGSRKHHEVNVVFYVQRNASDEEVASLEPEIALEWVEMASLVDLDLRPEAIKAWLASGGSEGCTWVSTIEPRST